MRKTNTKTLGSVKLRCDQEFFLVAQQLRNRLEPDITLERAEGKGLRRSQQRMLRSISVSIQPLDDDFQPHGSVFWVVSRDVSLRGMGLISHEPFSDRYIRLGLVDQATTAIAEVRHNTAIGGKYPLYLVGVEFVGKLLDANGNLSPS